MTTFKHDIGFDLQQLLDAGAVETEIKHPVTGCTESVVLYDDGYYRLWWRYPLHLQGDRFIKWETDAPSAKHAGVASFVDSLRHRFGVPVSYVTPIHAGRI